jgi:FkbM family methyltransferase
MGFYPLTIVDVGAARGEWSTEVAKVYQKSRYILIDPLEEHVYDLQQVCRLIGNAEFKIAAVTERAGTVTINVHPDLDGSSLFLERESNINGEPRIVSAVALDDIVNELKLEGPFVIKADVQGAELKVLNGAGKLLPATEMIVLEVVLFDIFQGNGPQLFEIISYMKSKGFVVWDIFGLLHRPLDNALSQVDMVFVKEDGMFRKVHQYATEQQRVEQLKRIAEKNRKRIKT